MAVSADHRARGFAAECFTGSLCYRDLCAARPAGLAASARVICSGAKDLMKSEFVWMARASGFSGLKLVRFICFPICAARCWRQFWISIPVFIIAEANLGALGLGVAEPLPSLGSLLRELQEAVTLRPEPWRLLPLVVLIVVISSFQVLLRKQEVRV